MYIIFLSLLLFCVLHFIDDTYQMKLFLGRLNVTKYIYASTALKYSFKGTCTSLGYIYFQALYTSTPLHWRGKYCTFCHSTTLVAGHFSHHWFQ